MSTKQQLIEQICGLLTAGAGVRLYGPSSVTVTTADRKLAESKTVEFLENALLQLQKEQIRIAAINSPEVQSVNEQRRQDHLQFLTDTAFGKIFSTKLPGNLVALDNAANRQIILSWLNPGEDVITHEIFLEAIKNPNLLRQLTLGNYQDPTKKPERDAAQLEADRATFSLAARQFGLSDNQASFRLVRETLGSGFTSYAVGQAVDSGAVRIPAASQAEQEAYRQEYSEQRQEFLIHQATPQQLRQAARTETEQRRAAAVQQQADQQLQAAVERDAVMGFPPLPETWQGQKLDAGFIRKCDVATQKLLSKRFGSAALDLRLRGLQ